jgi:hypothetical protein
MGKGAISDTSIVALGRHWDGILPIGSALPAQGFTD